ncbi:MAG: ankyrin repeat domain-containing protein [Pyrinomonadaceae bacterium]
MEREMRYEANDNVKGRTPLMLAAFRGDAAAVVNLLERGADVNARDADGDTALMFAAFRGHGLVVALLLQYGANVYARARNGWTARRAAQSGLHQQIAETLRRAETDGAAVQYVN